MGYCLEFQKARTPVSQQDLDEILENALEEREALLKRRPKLKSFQQEIDEILIKAGCFENRMAVLGIMIEAKFVELSKHVSCLLVLTRKMKIYIHHVY